MPELGWVAFDAANGFCATDAHVRVAVGLDYLGAAPLRGTRYGGAGEALAVKVRIEQAAQQTQIEAALPVCRRDEVYRGWFAGGNSNVMTYCCGILGPRRPGNVRRHPHQCPASATQPIRSSFLIQPGQRIMAIATAGNLSISQSVVSILREGWENPDTGETETLMNAPTLFQAAQRVGRTVRQLYDLEGKALEASDVKFDVSFLLGGQIKGERPRLFMLYAAGNFIECTQDTPYLQIGEHKYGKPVLDRAITYDIDLYDALKVGLVSVDSTMRSNLSVGLPIDVLIARRDACDAELNFRIEPGEPYFHDLRERWSAALRAAHAGIPRPPYKNIR